MPKFFLRFLHVSLVGDKDGGLSEGVLALVATTNLCGGGGGGRGEGRDDILSMIIQYNFSLRRLGIDLYPDVCGQPLAPPIPRCDGRIPKQGKIRDR